MGNKTQCPARLYEPSPADSLSGKDPHRDSRVFLLTGFFHKDMSRCDICKRLRGGVGSIYGAVLGGLIIGVAESMSVPLIGAAYKPAVGFLIMFLILLCYPRGILGERS